MGNQGRSVATDPKRESSRRVDTLDDETLPQEELPLSKNGAKDGPARKTKGIL